MSSARRSSLSTCFSPSANRRGPMRSSRAPTLSLDLADYGIAGVSIGERQIPLDEDGRLLVRYRGPERTFSAVSIADILGGKADAALLRDRVVLIGNTAQGIGDIRVTPYGRAFPGVEVRANIIEGLLA